MPAKISINQRINCARCRPAAWLSRAFGLASALAFTLAPRAAHANPQGMTVVNGNVSTAQNGSQLNITASQNAVINWQSFNLKVGETTTFIQPSATSIVWNRILDQNPSQILGNINANGYVVLANQNGFYFGPKSVINVGGLIATTTPINPMDQTGGAFWQFNGAPPAANIVNYGEIKTPSGGGVYLIAEKIENHGTISVPDGTLGLYAGKEVLLSERPDGRGLSARVQLPEGSIDNTGKLIADAGTIALQAQVVNVNGLVQANSMRERNGAIEFYASDAVNLGPQAVISAKGDGVGVSNGGSVTIKSDGAYSDSSASRIDVSGGASGGNGGNVEISAVQMPSILSAIDGHAVSGWTGGNLLLDPDYIVISDTGSGTAPGGTVAAGSGPSTLTLGYLSAFTGFSNIKLQANHDITISAGVNWNLNISTGISDPGSLLTLEAGDNIIFQNNASIVAGNGWSVNLFAGRDFNTANGFISGHGGVYFNGGPADMQGVLPTANGSIELFDGDINIEAGKEVLVNAGYIRTIGGGNINITTLSGKVDAGNKSDTYTYGNAGYQVSLAGLGGIGTVHGGDVTIDAGGDVVGTLASIGAFGAEHGDVSVTSHNGTVFGKYYLRNGQGSIQTQGGDVGSFATPVTLSLVSGNWDLNSAGSIYLNEVQNPNGTFNNIQRITSPVTGERSNFIFDYAANAGVKLEAADAVDLLGSSLSRTSANRDLLPLYPPKLEIIAGSGGVVLGNDVILYPSAQGSLEITTTDGGSLTSLPGTYHQIVMSDSDSIIYKNFVNGHAATPLHLNDPDPVLISIAGDIDNIFIRVPKVAEITVGGSTLNFGFEGQNLHATDQTIIAVAGDMKSRSDRTFETVTSDPNMDVFQPLPPLTSTNPELAARITYDPVTKTLGLQGIMTDADRQYLLTPTVYMLDVSGNIVVDLLGNPITKPATFTDAATINKLYQDSQDIPTSSLASNGYQVGGPGKFTVTAHNLDLGITKGIRSPGTGLNSHLASISQQGADISVHLTGDLTLSSSQIASFSGGSIDVKVGGSANIGAQTQFTSDDVPKGIYTVSGGDVSVEAVGNINVNGSRIAAFDGGNVTVVSTDGDVDAGSGGLGAVSLVRNITDPVTGKVTQSTVTVGISGIAATSFPDSGHQTGNITVSAGRDILANLGGVRQAAFGGSSAGSQVILTAGRDIQAGQSGVIGENIKLTAGGDISGFIVARGNLALDTVRNVNVTAIAGAGATISAGGTVSGHIASSGGIDVSGGNINAALSSNNVSTSGNADSATKGVQAVQTAPVAKVADSASDKIDKKADMAADDSDEEAKKRKKGSAPKLVKYVGRVTVILPGK